MGGTPYCMGLALLAAAGAAAGAPGPSPLERHAAEVRASAPAGFTVVVQPPFVVLGDEAPAAVTGRAARTVKWAVDLLKKEFFARDPEDIIDIWLFRDGASYTNHVRTLFRDEPGTPFGYYSPTHRALIMNIRTGGGTLVHELVHPFVRANFSNCPAWFNEGLASLFEQCREEGGRIRGLTNWRLPALQEAIRGGGVLPFEKLTTMGDAAFYGEDTGGPYNQHYAQARYLCYYLQEQGLLARFYHEFAAAAAQDPGGYRTLQHVLGQPDMAAFQRRWDAFVLGLHFP